MNKVFLFCMPAMKAYLFLIGIDPPKLLHLIQNSVTCGRSVVLSLYSCFLLFGILGRHQSFKQKYSNKLPEWHLSKVADHTLPKTGAVEPESAHIVNKPLVSIKLSNKRYIFYVYSNTTVQRSNSPKVQ
jgi:hypothetical protein